MKLVHLDLETTGVDVKLHGVCQISGIIEIDNVIKEKFDFLVKPRLNVIYDPGALKVNKRTEEEMQTFEDMESVYKKLITILSKYINKFDKTDKAFIVAYNSKFDVDFLRRWFLDCNDKYFGSWFWSNSIDIMALASEMLKHVRHEMINFKLKTVAEAFEIPINEEEVHDGMYDVEISKQIYDKMVN